jgi:hypothetical protein
MRRWTKIAVAVAVVVCLSGWFAEPYAQDWWLTSRACAGVLPADAVEQLMPEDAHLADAETQKVDGLGSYQCELTVKGDEGASDHLFLKTTAYTRRDDQDREFTRIFPDSGFASIAPLPEGLPGFVDTHHVIRLVLPCPDLPPGPAGRKRTMLVSTDLGYYATKHSPPRDAYEVTVAFAESASEKLGCGAEPLHVPDSGREPVSLAATGEPKTVPLSQVTGTACGWLAEAGLPRDTEWRVAVRTNGSAPVSRCDVSTGGDLQGEEHHLDFVGWYGDWSVRLAAWRGMRGTLTAAARCGGHAAHYKMRVIDDPSIDADLKQQLFEAFVRHEAGRHGCADLHFTF